jgi:hypothetical protein
MRIALPLQLFARLLEGLRKLCRFFLAPVDLLLLCLQTPAAVPKYHCPSPQSLPSVPRWPFYKV